METIKHAILPNRNSTLCGFPVQGTKFCMVSGDARWEALKTCQKCEKKAQELKNEEL
jgi:hypothetical protein